MAVAAAYKCVLHHIMHHYYTAQVIAERIHACYSMTFITTDPNVPGNNLINSLILIIMYYTNNAQS